MWFGTYGYLSKPSDTEDLITKINEAYDRKVEHEKRINMTNRHP